MFSPHFAPPELGRTSAAALPRDRRPELPRAVGVLGFTNRPTGIEGADPGRFTGEFYGMAVDLAELELCFFGV